jgi:arabinogalactan endo-1,4-beta-galactosidase
MVIAISRLGLLVAACALFLPGIVSAQTQTSSKTSSAFVTGADLSELPYYESLGVKYADGGKSADLLAIAQRNHWRIIRVRLWVNPSDDPKASVSSLANVTALGKRIKADGFEFFLDLHYSDTWADPGHQFKPAAWNSLPFPALVQKVHDYSRDVIVHLRQNGAMPDLVQVGNETKNGLLYGSGIDGTNSQPGGGFWEPDKQGMERAAQLFAAGLSGVRAGASNRPLLTLIHVPDGQDLGFVKWYFSSLSDAAEAAHVTSNYDMIGLSYYPGTPWDRKAGFEPWSLSHLTASMNYIAGTLHKPLMIVETSWPRAGDSSGITGSPEFPLTPAGQVQFYSALVHAVRAVPNGSGRGVVVWEPDTLDWNSVFDAHGNAQPAVRVLGQP